MTVIGHLEQISREWLELVLTRHGALTSGGVRAFEAKWLENSTNARFARIRLQYEAGSTGTLPESLLLKVCWGGVFGSSEVEYYMQDYAGLKDAPLPACYDAEYAPATRRYHILMADLSATHRDNHGKTPTLEYGIGTAEALAQLHAHHWGDTRIPTASEIRRYVQQSRPGLEPMLADLGDGIEESEKTALFEVFDQHAAKMIERTGDRQGLALIHGDPNPGNVLSPLGEGKTYLVDRQPFDWSLTTWLGVSDVAYMMVHWWPPELRRRFELQVLSTYHQALIAQGVVGYAWTQLLADYKLSAVQSIYVATERCVREEERANLKWVWWPQLQKALTAYFDLDCASLWRKQRD